MNLSQGGSEGEDVYLSTYDGFERSTLPWCFPPPRAVGLVARMPGMGSLKWRDRLRERYNYQELSTKLGWHYILRW